MLRVIQNYPTVAIEDSDQEENMVITIEDQEYIRDFFSASLTGHPDIMKEIISISDLGANIVNASDNRGTSPLHCAATRGHEDVIEFLLSQPNININPRDDQGQTALHLAAEKGYLNVIKLLMNAGAQASIPNHKGETPVDWLKFWATTENKLDIVSETLDAMEDALMAQNNSTHHDDALIVGHNNYTNSHYIGD
ncbi:ankyrin repeat domain-containing protein [Candidatus Phycorickettsia trachydisci]|nr:ankyrin repeat domain-containing protein [Candidatus Phycorickettsia trachydisci]